MRSATARSGIILALAALLQSCGGGGGGGGGGNPPPPPAGGLINLTTGDVQIAGILTFGTSEDALQSMQLLSVATEIMHQELLVPQQFQCTVAGNVRLTAQDNDLNSSLSAGDRVVVTFNDCDQETRGTISLLISQIAFNAGNVSSLGGNITLDLELLGFANLTLTGSGQLAYTVTANDLTWLGTNFSIRAADNTQTEALSGGRIEKTVFGPPFHFAIEISGTIDSDALGGRFTFASTQPYVGPEGSWPANGFVTLSGRSGSKITYQSEGGPGMFTASIDADGNGSFEVHTTPLPWTEISSGYLFGVTGGPVDPDDPPPPPGGDVLGRRIALGSSGEDLEVDAARARIYVTLRNRNELVVINANTLEIVQRVLVGPEPRAMSMSLDGEELFIGLSAAGEIAVVDLDTFVISRVFVAETQQNSQAYDVAESSPGVLFVTHASTRSGVLVRLDRPSGNQIAVPNIGTISMETELLADPARDVIYVGTGAHTFPQSLYKIGATDPSAPLLLEDQHGSLGGTERMSLSPDGTRIYLRSGQVVRTDDFVDFGHIARGVPWAADNGVDVMVADDTSTLHIYAALGLTLVDTLTTDCALSAVSRLKPSSVDGQWLMLGGPTLCAIDLNNPRQPPGTGQPGIPGNPPPTRNVPVVDLPLGAEAFDAEFDFSRNRVYVSLPSTGEVLTIDAAARQITQREQFGNAPRGLDLSPDESVLAVLFNGNGNLGFKDLASGQTDMRDISAELATPLGHDVAYLNDDAIFASADYPPGEAYLVRTSRLNPANTTRLGNGGFVRDRPELALDPDGRFLIQTESDQVVFKRDLGDPQAPIELVYSIPNFFGGDRISLNGDGTRLALRNGHVMRTADLTQAGSLANGVPLYTQDGMTAYVAGAPGRIERFDTTSYVATQVVQGNCSIGTPRRLLANAADDVLITVGQSRLCFWLLAEPTASSLRTGAQSAYVCGSECLKRRYEKQIGGGRWGWQLRSYGPRPQSGD